MRSGWRALSLVVPAWSVLLLHGAALAFSRGRDGVALGYASLAILALLTQASGERAG